MANVSVLFHFGRPCEQSHQNCALQLLKGHFLPPQASFTGNLKLHHYGSFTADNTLPKWLYYALKDHFTLPVWTCICPHSPHSIMVLFSLFTCVSTNSLAHRLTVIKHLRCAGNCWLTLPWNPSEVTQLTPYSQDLERIWHPWSCHSRCQAGINSRHLYWMLTKKTAGFS